MCWWIAIGAAVNNKNNGLCPPESKIRRLQFKTCVVLPIVSIQGFQLWSCAYSAWLLPFRSQTQFFFFFSKKPFSALTPNLLLHFFVYVDIRSQYSLNNLYFSTQPTMILVTKLALGRFIYCIFIIYSFNRSMRAGIMLTLFISVTSVWGIVSLLNEYLLNYWVIILR